MSVASFIARLTHPASVILSDVEKVAHVLAPQIETDLKAFMATLPSAFASLEAAGEKAMALVKDLHGVSISKTVGILVAQKVFAEKAVSAEAAALLGELEAK